MPQDKLPEPGEFTRIFKRQHLGAQGATDSEKGPGEVSGVFKAPEPSPAPAAAQPSVPPPPPSTPTPPGTSSAATPGEPGEFTQYFMGGLPQKSPLGSPTAGTTQRTPSGVQRPNTPVPPRPPSSDSNSNFTDHFAPPAAWPPPPPAQRISDYGMHNPRIGDAPDLSGQTSTEDGGAFDFRPNVPQPLPSKHDAPGEYTKLFGPGSIPLPSKQSAVAPAPAAPIMSDSPNSVSRGPLLDRTLKDIPAAAPAPRGPSEFTVVSNGRQAAPAAPGASPEAATSTMATKKLPVNVNIAPINPLSALPGGGSLHVPTASAGAGVSGAHLNTPIGSANMSAPPIPQLKVPPVSVPTSRLSDQTKLILFFAVLAILAVILVVVLAATQKN